MLLGAKLDRVETSISEYGMKCGPGGFPHDPDLPAKKKNKNKNLQRILQKFAQQKE